MSKKEMKGYLHIDIPEVGNNNRIKVHGQHSLLVDAVASALWYDDDFREIITDALLAYSLKKIAEDLGDCKEDPGPRVEPGVN